MTEKKAEKKGKQMLESNYIKAFQVMYGKWYSIDPCDRYKEGEESCFPLYSKALSAEKCTIKKDEWNNLSSEAKEVIQTILSGPNEILEIIQTPERKLLTKRSITRYFRSIWKSRFISNITIKEITKWVNQL